MRIIEIFKEKAKLIEENMKIRKGKVEVELKLEQLTSNYQELQSKYINLLEQKSEKFDLYVAYQNKCLELTNEKRELKKQLADKNEQCNTLTEENSKLLSKLEKPRKKSVAKNEKSA